MDFDFPLVPAAFLCGCHDSPEWRIWRHALHSNRVHMHVDPEPLRVACLGMRSPYSHHIGASWTCAFIVDENFVRTKRHKPFVMDTNSYAIPLLFVKLRVCILIKSSLIQTFCKVPVPFAAHRNQCPWLGHLLGLGLLKVLRLEPSKWAQFLQARGQQTEHVLFFCSGDSMR